MTDTPSMTMFDLYIAALRRFARIQRETAARYALDGRLEAVRAERACLRRADEAEAKADRLEAA